MTDNRSERNFGLPSAVLGLIPTRYQSGERLRPRSGGRLARKRVVSLHSARHIRPLQGRGALPYPVPPVAPAVRHLEALQASAFLSGLSLNLITVLVLAAQIH